MQRIHLSRRAAKSAGPRASLAANDAALAALGGVGRAQARGGIWGQNCSVSVRARGVSPSSPGVSAVPEPLRD